MAVNYDEHKNKVTMPDYEAIEKANMEKANQQHADYSEKNQAAMDNYIATIEEANRLAQEATRKEYEQGVESTRQGYQPVYDRNAIAEEIGRRNIAETLSSMGLRDSGTSRTTQTALSVARAKADSDTSLQREAAIDALTAQLDKYIAESEANIAAQKGQAAYDSEQRVMDNWQSLFQNAQANAQNQYNADRSYAQNEIAERVAADQFNQQMSQSESQFARSQALQRELAGVKAQQEAEAAYTAVWNNADSTEELYEKVYELSEMYNDDRLSRFDMYNTIEASPLSDNDKTTIYGLLGMSDLQKIKWGDSIPGHVPGSNYAEWFEVLSPIFGWD